MTLSIEARATPDRASATVKLACSAGIEIMAATYSTVPADPAEVQKPQQKSVKGVRRHVRAVALEGDRDKRTKPGPILLAFARATAAHLPTYNLQKLQTTNQQQH